jgi:hypothetical protein
MVRSLSAAVRACFFPFSFSVRFSVGVKAPLHTVLYQEHNNVGAMNQFCSYHQYILISAQFN